MRVKTYFSWSALLSSSSRHNRDDYYLLTWNATTRATTKCLSRIVSSCFGQRKELKIPADEPSDKETRHAQVQDAYDTTDAITRTSKYESIELF